MLDVFCLAPGCPFVGIAERATRTGKALQQALASDGSGIIGPTMFTKSAAFYDLLYSFKDYAAEADKVRRVIDAANNSSGHRLLDVACGTGQHLHHFELHFEAEGLDLDTGLLTIALTR